MENLVVELPGEMKEFLEKEAESAGLSGASDFVRQLIAQAQKQKAVEMLERMAEEAIQSGRPSDWTHEDVSNLRIQLRAKLDASQGPKR